MRVVVLSDTHVRDVGITGLPDEARRQLDVAHAILHAGDVVEAPLLRDLGAVAPVHAVLGNNDVGIVVPETLVVELDGVRVAMIHDSGGRAGREGRMRRRFPDADLVVFGHSHQPVNQPGLDGQLLFNPGSPTQRRRSPHRTIGILDLAAGRIRRAEIVEVD